MVNIVICGANGKMGKTVAECIKNRSDCRIAAGVDVNAVQCADFPVFASPKDLPQIPDVIIDYSHPSTLPSLLEYGMLTGTPIVLATTGYSDEQILEIKKAAEQIPIFFTFNMSLGINLLVELAKKAAAVLGGRFDIEIIEKHHNQKIDAPSGTALMLANAVNDVLDDSKRFTYDRHSIRKKRDKNEIGIHSMRGGTIVGEHEVIFAGNDEVITLSHSAASKTVFAEGSVNAAVFLKGKQPGLYDMSCLV